jgi:hypothetical protein
MFLSLFSKMVKPVRSLIDVHYRAMLLSRIRFDQIVRALRATCAVHVREAWTPPRVLVRGWATIARCGQAEGNLAADLKFIDVSVHDVSPSEIFFLYHTAVLNDEQVILRLPGDPDIGKAIVCQVERCQRVDDVLFVVAAKFIQEIDLPDVPCVEQRLIA